MADQFGISFIPNAQNQPQQMGQPAGGQATSPQLQQAIKLISLRLPKVVGGSPIAPAPLLTSQGGKGMPSPDSVAQQVLQRVLPTGQAPVQAPMQAPATAFSPNPLASSPIKQDTGWTGGYEPGEAASRLPNIVIGGLPGGAIPKPKLPSQEDQSTLPATSATVPSQNTLTPEMTDAVDQLRKKFGQGGDVLG